MQNDKRFERRCTCHRPCTSWSPGSYLHYQLQILTTIEKCDRAVSFMEKSQNQLTYSWILMPVLLDTQRSRLDFLHSRSSDIFQDWTGISDEYQLLRRLGAGVRLHFHDLVDALCGGTSALITRLRKYVTSGVIKENVLIKRIAHHEFYKLGKERTANFHHE